MGVRETSCYDKEREGSVAKEDKVRKYLRMMEVNILFLLVVCSPSKPSCRKGDEM